MLPDFLSYLSTYLAATYAQFTVEIFTAQFYVALAAIIGVDLLLSGDNALVIAAVTNKLPDAQRKVGIIAGSALAVFLRIALALLASKLITTQFLAMAGGLYLVYVAYELVAPETAGKEPNAATSIWSAVAKIAFLDLSMSFDNVLSISSMAHGSASLMIIGIAISIPMVILFSLAISAALQRCPSLKWIGAVLLAFVAGKVISHDPAVTAYFLMDSESLTWTFAPMAVVIVVSFGVIARIIEQQRRIVENMEQSLSHAN